MEKWLILIVTLPTEASTLRMRLWRAIKAVGAGVLRDGVYVLPDQESCRTAFNVLDAEVNAVEGGSAVQVEGITSVSDYFRSLFDRGEQYTALLRSIEQVREDLGALPLVSAEKQARKLRKSLQAVQTIDYFPNGKLLPQVESALLALENNIRQIHFPNEPHFTQGAIPKRDITAFRGRQWATRQRPWVDRMASAWLIKRFIDPDARFLWLPSPDGCPSDAVGFDFDGATFSHIQNNVTFEVLMKSFQLALPALHRLAGIVHFLDVGGIEPTEAAGIERVLAGMRASINDDDQLLQATFLIFDSLITEFQQDKKESTSS